MKPLLLSSSLVKARFVVAVYQNHTMWEILWSPKMLRDAKRNPRMRLRLQSIGRVLETSLGAELYSKAAKRE